MTDNTLRINYDLSLTTIEDYRKQEIVKLQKQIAFSLKYEYLDTTSEFILRSEREIERLEAASLTYLAKRLIDDLVYNFYQEAGCE